MKNNINRYRTNLQNKLEIEENQFKTKVENENSKISEQKTTI